MADPTQRDGDEEPEVTEKADDQQLSEREKTGEPDEISSKYDPALIRVDPRTFSLHQIIDMLDAGELDLTPDFQRKKVWKPWQKSRLIESIFLRIPLPAFYFAADGDGLIHVVDGLQRLSTIYDFVKGSSDFSKLSGLEYLTEAQLGGMEWDTIGSSWKRRLHTTQIFAHVIDPQTPMPVKFQIFRRLNQGGEPLNSIEIINSICRRRSRDFLRKLANSSIFLKWTEEKLKDHPRMEDRDSVLIICALHLQADIGSVDSFEDFDDFLVAAVRFLDNPQKCSTERIEQVETLFKKGINTAVQIREAASPLKANPSIYIREAAAYLFTNLNLQKLSTQKSIALIDGLFGLDLVAAIGNSFTNNKRPSIRRFCIFLDSFQKQITSAQKGSR